MQRRISRLLASVIIATSLGACDGDPVTPSEATAGFTAVTTTQVAGIVGAAVTPVPAVKALDSRGDPVAGLEVSFAVTGGGTLGRTTSTTDARGVADVGSWTLGTTAGAQTVVATAAGRSVTFTAAASAGAASALTAAAGATNAALTGATVGTPPAVKVADRYGNPVAGAGVVFTIGTGDGTVTGATVTTGADGIATVGGWKLGVVPGEQTLVATSGSLSAKFTATASLPRGCSAAPYLVGVTIPASWAADDCANATPFAAAGAVYDQYQLRLDTQQNVRFELTGATGRSLRIRRAGAPGFVALPLGASFTTTNGNTLVSRHLLAAGDYVIEVQAPEGTVGDYSLASRIDDGDIVCRPVVQGTIGITFQGSLDASTDCASPVAPGTYEDWIVLPLTTGDRFRITVTTTTMPAGFVLRDDRLGPASPTLAVRTSPTPGTLTLDWTATFDTYHELVIFKNAGPDVAYGSYTVRIEPLP